MDNPYISNFISAFWLPGRVPRTPQSSEGRKIVPLKFDFASVSYPDFAQAARQEAPASAQFAQRFESIVNQEVTNQVRPYLICRLFVFFMLLYCIVAGVFTTLIYYVFDCIGYGVLILLWMLLMRILMNRMEKSMEEFELFFRGRLVQLNRAFLVGDIQVVSGASMRWLEIQSQRYQPPQMRVDVVPMGVPV